MNNSKQTKITTKKYEVKFFPGSWNMKHGKFIKIRQAHGLKTKPYETCFCCERRFADEEIPVFITVSGIGNMFACRECADKEVE